MFGDPSGPLSDPLGSGQPIEIMHGLLPVPLDRRRSRADFTMPGRTQAELEHVVALMTAPAAAADPIACASIVARPGGIDGDRYQNETGTFSTSPRRVGQDITLIEVEALDELASARRQHLSRGGSPERRYSRHRSRRVDRRAVPCGRCRVLRAAPRGPCAHLERLAPGALRNLVHRGGLRADIVEPGTINVGDAIRAETPRTVLILQASFRTLAQAGFFTPVAAARS